LYLRSLGLFDEEFLDYLGGFRFTGDVEAIPEGTVTFANEPLLRVTAPLIEAQLIETVLLNQINFQTMIATKAARIVLAAGGGEPGTGDRVLDFSPRRDHGVDAAMKVARSAAVAGCGGTSNVAAAMRYGLRPVGTMAHSYVLAFDSEEEAFRSFIRSFPSGTVLLVDTYDTLQGVRNAIAAARDSGVGLAGIRLDSGDLLTLSRAARELLDEAGMEDTSIAASGDLHEGRIGDLVAAGAPIDLWGVGTDLGTSRDSPVVNGVYKLVATGATASGTGCGSGRPTRPRCPAPSRSSGPRQSGRSPATSSAPMTRTWTASGCCARRCAAARPSPPSRWSRSASARRPSSPRSRRSCGARRAAPRTRCATRTGSGRPHGLPSAEP
jgi:nicotinate phosphoribosyltransferase